ncbi:MAG: head maturation protease, ClpP-related [Verrucomicrobiia bacterium]
MSRPHWFKIYNALEDPDEADVLIYGEIGAEGCTAKDFIDALKATGAKRFNVHINSPGGDIAEGLAIYNFMRSQNCRVTVDSMAGSIAAVIAMAGRSITMAEGARMVIHDPYAIVEGTSQDLRDAAVRIDQRRAEIVNIFARRTGQEPAQIKAWMDAETWMTGKRAVDLGFADEVEGVASESFALLNLARFKHIPVDTSTPATMKLDEALTALETEKGKIVTLTTERDALKTGKTEMEGKLSAKDSDISTLKGQISALTAERDTIKTTLKTEQDARAADKAAADAALAIEKNSVQAKVDEELAKLGQKRLAIAGAGAGDLDLKSKKREEFNKLSPKAQLAFINEGGVVTD